MLAHHPMAYRLMARGLPGIVPGVVDAGEFAARTRMGEAAAADTMERLCRMGIGERVDGSYRYAAGQRLEAAIMLLGGGCPVDEVAPALHWRDFEGLAAGILESEGFEVSRNYRAVRPRMEIDVVGTRMGVAMLVDCKHWRRRSSLAAAVDRQVARAERWASMHRMPAVPVIVTLHQWRSAADGVPVVPVSKFRSFVAEFFGMLESVRVIPAG